jgi:hypothetical protein
MERRRDRQKNGRNTSGTQVHPTLSSVDAMALENSAIGSRSIAHLQAQPLGHDPLTPQAIPQPWGYTVPGSAAAAVMLARRTLGDRQGSFMMRLLQVRAERGCDRTSHN